MSPSPRAETTVGAGPAVEAWEALLRSQVALWRLLEADDVWEPITPREYDVLHTLGRCPDGRARIRDLHREVLLSQPSLSRLVERMAEAGLVAREPDPADGRGTVVVLTETGDRLRRRVGARHAESIRRTVGVALDEREQQALRLLCDKLRAGART
ncbi:MarR family winged helix-turn-helix transcriptional regulator [Pseudonocardia benzenivorans]|uniref:MarR family winged helix-turn-helix transcriptional regulator n=1 Tax=Pseudonocardia benzenivorans TaxID=228005 RepID=A0ABW3VFN3_9PSEU